MLGPEQSIDRGQPYSRRTRSEQPQWMLSPRRPCVFGSTQPDLSHSTGTLPNLKNLSDPPSCDDLMIHARVGELGPLAGGLLAPEAVRVRLGEEGGRAPYDSSTAVVRFEPSHRKSGPPGGRDVGMCRSASL